MMPINETTVLTLGSMHTLAGSHAGVCGGTGKDCAKAVLAAFGVWTSYHGS